MHKLRYILSVLGVVFATLLIVVAPDISSAITTAQLDKEVVYDFSTSSVAKPITPEEVASAHRNNTFIYSYSNEKPDIAILKKSAEEVIEQFFGDNEAWTTEFLSHTTDMKNLYADQVTALIMTEDRIASVELVNVSFESGLSVFFEKTTGLILDITLVYPGLTPDSAERLMEDAEASAEVYYQSMLGECDSNHSMIAHMLDDYVYINIHIQRYGEQNPKPESEYVY